MLWGHVVAFRLQAEKFLDKNHASRIGEKSTQTRQLISDIPTYDTVHFYNLLHFEHYAIVMHLV